MEVSRRRLTVLLNALYDEGVDSIPVKHPSTDIRELVRIELEMDGQVTVRFTQGSFIYQDIREAIPAKHGATAIFWRTCIRLDYRPCLQTPEDFNGASAPKHSHWSSNRDKIFPQH